MQGIRFNQVLFSYLPTIPVIENLTFQLDEQQTIVLLGANGSGKSTFLKLCFGYLKALQGNILVRGEEIRGKNPNWIGQHFAYAPQSPIYPYHLTVEDYILLGRTPYLSKFMSPSEKDQIALENVLEQLNITYLRKRILQELSGGEQQLSSFGRVIIQQTPFILLDELVAELDIKNILNVLRILGELKQKHTIFFSTHDPQIAEAIADTIILFKPDHQIEYGKPDMLLTVNNLSKMYGISGEFIQESPIQILWKRNQT